MSRILTELPGGKSGRIPKYPYDEWLDGQVRELKRGVDFVPEARSFVGTFRQYALRHGIEAKFIAAGDLVYVQATQNGKAMKRK
jgi:hypothetical protein